MSFWRLAIIVFCVASPDAGAVSRADDWPVYRQASQPAWPEPPPIDFTKVWVETPSGRPVIDRGPGGAWDHCAVDNPFVLVDGDTLCCFYEAQDKAFSQGGHERIGLATSQDGVHWAKSKQNPILDVGPPAAWDSVVAKLPAVFKHEGSYYSNCKSQEVGK